MANTAVRTSAMQPHDDTAPTPFVRRAQRLRAAVLVIIGLVIAFSATLHSSLAFDRWVLFASLLAVGATVAVEYVASRDRGSSGLMLVSAVIAVLAAVMLSLTNVTVDSTAIALVVIAWASIGALITVIRGVRGELLRRVAIPSALLSAALAFALALVHLDIIAVVGFFGAYAVIRGVFLGIQTFDTADAKRRSSIEHASSSGSPAAGEVVG